MFHIAPTPLALNIESDGPFGAKQFSASDLAISPGLPQIGLFGLIQKLPEFRRVDLSEPMHGDGDFLPRTAGLFDSHTVSSAVGFDLTNVID